MNNWALQASPPKRFIKSSVLVKKFLQPPAQAKFKDEYPELSIDWKKIYSLVFSVTLDTSLRVFQYKLLNRIVFTNNKLYKFKIVDSPLCTFCKIEEESLEHILFSCKATEVFWKEVLSLLAIYKNKTLIFLLMVQFGKFDNDKEFMVINHILLLAKSFIYRCKLDNTKPS